MSTYYYKYGYRNCNNGSSDKANLQSSEPNDDGNDRDDAADEGIPFICATFGYKHNGTLGEAAERRGRNAELLSFITNRNKELTFKHAP
ncbi:hypothetical protein FSP39_018070 [Pinctada imbricata]|uniref:Uncharacterized protein n=1 Tax=Pinctada imbricata TaxID=66713 RepID=A0AA88YN87_PINIB|nr:hypothetical protein FSP39_018070 [Pinctada imbricata]